VTPRTDVDVVIVAHNAGELLVDAVRSAAQQAGEDRVWVMDAESTDTSAAQVTAAFPAVHVRPVPNAGFSASNNRGIETTSAPYVLLLNPDAELRSGALDALVAAAERDARIGVVGPLVLLPEGAVQPDSFGRFPTLARRMATGASRVWWRIRGDRSPSPNAPAEAVDVDWVTGACMLVRRAAITDAGAMDEGFFLYYEDLEWCHRMRDRGWRVVLDPAAQCIHHLGQSNTSSDVVARAYRESFFRYCDLYGLWGLKAAARFGLATRQLLGGRL